jgi:hypothetical protein
MDASGQQRAMGASGQKRAMGASRQKRAMGASRQKRAMGASSFGKNQNPKSKPFLERKNNGSAKARRASRWSVLGSTISSKKEALFPYTSPPGFRLILQ